MRFFSSSLWLILVAGAALRAEPVTPAPAPVWKLKDVNGKVVSSEDFKGKVILIDFWATWCVPCRDEFPGFVELQKKYGKDGFIIVGISANDGDGAADAVKSFAGKMGVNFEIVLADPDVEQAFGVNEGLPMSFIIDRAGKIRDRKLGAETMEDLEKRLLPVLKS